MELIESIKMPNFTRTQFANLESKEVWEPKIEKAKLLYPKLELETVVHGIRPAMIDHHTSPNDIDRKARYYAKKGLMLVPLRREQAFDNFSHVSHGYNGQGDNFVYRSVVTKNSDIATQFIEADRVNDHVKVGELLGFPTSSGEFFEDFWSKGYFDPIWQQAENTRAPEILKNRRDFKDPLGNIDKKLIRFRASDESYIISSVFRYIGVRLLSHLPRSFNDEESIVIANKWIQLAKDLKLEGLEETLEILRLPYEWDCNKGVAVINTPVMKIVTNSVPCYPNHIIQQESNFYPSEAPNGIQFPWTMKLGC